MTMTREQEDHLDQLKAEFVTRVDTKYRRGQKEHGGDVWRISTIALLEHAIDEAVDQVVYLLTMRAQLEREFGG